MMNIIIPMKMKSNMRIELTFWRLTVNPIKILLTSNWRYLLYFTVNCTQAKMFFKWNTDIWSWWSLHELLVGMYVGRLILPDNSNSILQQIG